MLNNKKINIIISILVAICLWAYVVGQVNPSTTKKISGVEVQFTNEDILTEEGLALLNPGDITVDVTVKGNIRNVKKVKASDITVTASLSECSKGENSIKLKVKVPKSVEATKTSKETIIVNIEKRVTQIKSVKPIFSGLSDGKEAGNISVNPRTEEVSGAKSTVESVEYVQATVNAEDIEGDAAINKAVAVPVDKNGNEVAHIILSDSTVEVKASLLITKEISLKVKIKGNVDKEKQLVKIDAPSKVTIRGNKSDIKNIGSITAKTVDVSGIKETTTIPLEFDFPKAVELATTSKNIGVEIILKDLDSKKIDFSNKEIDIKNLGTNLKAEINTDSITGTATGTEEQISGLKKGDFSLYIDLDGLGVGTHSVVPKVTYNKTISGITLNPKEVRITVSEE